MARNHSANTHSSCIRWLNSEPIQVRIAPVICPLNKTGRALNLSSAFFCGKYFAGITTDRSDRLAYHSYENANQAYNKGEPSLRSQNTFCKPVNGTSYCSAVKDLWLSSNYLPGNYLLVDPPNADRLKTAIAYKFSGSKVFC